MITAVVITRNEEKNIARALSSLSDERITEIIVSDSNSSDATKEIVEKAAMSDERIKFISYKTAPFTAARGRNEGARIAKKENSYLLFIDGDMEFIPEFLDESMKALQLDDELFAIAGQMHNYYYDESGCVINKQHNYYRIKDSKPGGAMLVEKKPFNTAGCYNANLVVNEESELCHRLMKVGRKFKRINEPMVVHHTEAHTNKLRIRERILDKKITALSNNLVLVASDFKYFQVLIKENKYTMLSSLVILLSIFLLALTPKLSVALVVVCYVGISLKCKSFRIGLNYVIYGAGLLIGVMAHLISLARAKMSKNK